MSAWRARAQAWARAIACVLLVTSGASSAPLPASPQQAPPPAPQQELSRQPETQQQPPSPPQAPAFTTRAEAIRVDVLVTHLGKPVSGLTANDFVLRDNGVRQKVRLLGQGNGPIDVVLALDVSSSVHGERLRQLTDGVRALLDRLQPGDRLGLITFFHHIAMPVPLTADFAQVRALLTQVQGRGATSLNDAAFLALLAGDSSVRTLVIVFTDGLDNASWLSPNAAVAAARRLDAVVYGLTMVMRRPESTSAETVMELLPDATGGRRIETARLDDVSETFREIVKEFRQRYVLAFEPDSTQQPGWHTIAVTLKPGRSGRIRARSGYYAER